MALSIDKNRCPQNHRCPLIKVCAVQAITQHEHELPIIDAQKCIECGECIKFCGKQAIYNPLDNQL